ncbi:MAG: glucokinase [Pseudomonas sp.]|nr:glucokinase [Pseudomonas sp.]
MKLALVGDIGGTNARFALWRDDHLEAVQVLATADFPGPEQAIMAYLQAQGLPLGAIGSVCLACAGPVSGDLFRFTNNHWRIDRTAFCQALQVDELLMINDFFAMALGMTRLAEHERIPVCEGQAQAERPVLVIGAAGGPTIPVTVARAIIGVLDFGLGAQDALAIPFAMSFGETLLIEEGSALAAMEGDLAALGHKAIRKGAAPIKANALGRRADGSWEVATEPRNAGAVTP